jgi:hypothetical protein
MKTIGFTMAAVSLAAAAAVASGCAVGAEEAADEQAGREQVGEAHEALARGVFGELKAYGGNCLDLRSGNLGGVVQVFTCKGSWNQEWQLASNPEGPIYVDTAGLPALLNQGSGVTVETYMDIQTQLWTMPSVQIVSNSGSWCAAPDDGNVLSIYCNATDPTQQWSFYEYDWSIRTPTPGGGEACLTMNGTASGTAVTTAPCDGQPGQAWELSTSNHSIRPLADTSLCLDIRGGGGDNRVIQTFTCGGGSNQAWSFNGQIVSQSGMQCMSLPVTNGGPITASGTAVTMETCSNAAYYQFWTYAW